MNPFKKLAGQTAIYGLPTIVGRLLNYFLVPLYTYQFTPLQFGVVTELYAYVSFLLIILTFGMETTLFRFSNSEDDKKAVYGTALSSVLVAAITFILLTCLFAPTIAEWLHYQNHAEYIYLFAFIVGLDAFSSIPFAKLREQGKAKKFALLKSLNIAVNIALNVFFIGFCKEAFENGPSSLLGRLYNPEIGIVYIFISNLVATVITLLMLLPQMMSFGWTFNTALLRKMLPYTLPLLVAGLAGMVNETIDRLLIKYLIPDKREALTQLGIYGACYKVSILMTIFIQTFRYAAEPFFFSSFKETDSKQKYATVMNYFVIACSLIFLATVLNMQLVQYFIGKEYRVGLKIVPILLLANLFLGIFFNLSIWYKLTGKTFYGAWFTIFGATITLICNFWWIPKYGYVGSAWATLVCYVLMTVASYIVGNKHFNVNYDLKRITFYLSISLLLFLVSVFLPSEGLNGLVLKNLLIIPFLVSVYLIERKSIKKLLR